MHIFTLPTGRTIVVGATGKEQALIDSFTDRIHQKEAEIRGLVALLDEKARELDTQAGINANLSRKIQALRKKCPTT